MKARASSRKALSSAEKSRSMALPLPMSHRAGRRGGAGDHTGRGEVLPSRGSHRQEESMVRILTYNVHRCVGLDRRMDVGRVAQVIAAEAPDIVALQEVDVGRARTGRVDQAHALARRLGMAPRFHAALRVEEEQYGDAILTALPERLIRAGPLPGYA